VYNWDDAPVDYKVLNNIDQHKTLHSLGNVPTIKDMTAAISQMANNKAPGKSGIPAEALKALPPPALQVLHQLLCRFWRGEEYVYTEWQTALLRVLYKGKGDAREPTNYRGIVLQDAFARLTSIIVVN